MHVCQSACLLFLSAFSTSSSQSGPIKIFPDSYPSRRPGRNETEVFRDALPPALFERLHTFCDEYEALGRPDGQGTNFVPLHPQHKPRNPVEEVVRYLAKHAVGADPSWDGVDWWLQFRDPQNPKEYHTDSDTFRLKRHNERWHPQVSSIFWFSDAGGPSAVFNQSIKEFGGSPRVPSTVQLVFPRRNQYAIFMGDRYHGVLRPSADDPEGSAGMRKTLLINWWRIRPNEAQDADPEICRKGYLPILPWAQWPLVRTLGFAAPVRSVSLSLGASFDQHLGMWVGATMQPFEEVMQLVTSGRDKLSERVWRQHDFYTLDYLKPSQLALQIQEAQVVPNFGVWKLEPGPDGQLMVSFG